MYGSLSVTKEERYVHATNKLHNFTPCHVFKGLESFMPKKLAKEILQEVVT